MCTSNDKIVFMRLGASRNSVCTIRSHASATLLNFLSAFLSTRVEGRKGKWEATFERGSSRVRLNQSVEVTFQTRVQPAPPHHGLLKNLRQLL